MPKKTKKLKPSVAEDKPLACQRIDDVEPVAEAVKKGKKRKAHIAQEEQPQIALASVQDDEARQTRCKRKALQKAVQRLTEDLNEVQGLLKGAQTSAQLEKAIYALKSVHGLKTSQLLKLQEPCSQAQGIADLAPAKDVSETSCSGTNGTPLEQAPAATLKKKLKLDSADNVGSSDSSTFKRNFATWPVVSQRKAEKRRTALCVEIEEGEMVLPPVLEFSELQVLPKWVDQALAENGWCRPTPIQSQALPVLMSGRSLVGVAQTGSGKTGAFLLPAVVQIDAQQRLINQGKGPIVLVLAPTRELAVQISEEADKLLKYSNCSTNHHGGIRSCCFFGGAKKYDQLKRFSPIGSHIVVGTPGRLADCVSTGSISLSRVTYLVLDEADRMLDEGFSGEVSEILSSVRSDRQVALFSATWPASVQQLAKNVLGTHTSAQNAPVRIRVGAAPKAAEALQARESIHQEVVVIDHPPADWKKTEDEKSCRMEEHVRKVLTTVTDSKILVFVNTKVQADALSTKLWKEGFQADSMHGGRPQETRLNVLKRFRDGELRLLVVTDVFARGLDIPSVSHVVIFEMGETEDYIHRIGRTGRGVGGSGHALVFFEYWAGSPAIAEQLIGVLERSKQQVPEGLRKIAAEVQAGKRPTR